MAKQKMRLLKAVLYVAVVVAVIALWNPVSAALGASDEGAFLSSKTLLAGLASSEEKDVDSVVEESLKNNGGLSDVAEAPDWFEEEVVSLDATDEIRANEDWSVVGLTMEGELENVEQRVETELQEKGWTLMESGVDGQITGVKEGGNRTWLWLSCIETSGAISVVFQLPA